MRQFKNILCVTGLGGEPRGGLERAITLAEEHQARLTVLNVLEEIEPIVAPFPTGELEALKAKVHGAALEALEGAVAAARARIQVQTEVAFGTPFLEAIREVQRGGHDLLVKQAGGEGSGLFLSGTDRHLLRKCPCPVWLVKETAGQPYRRILAAVDFDPSNVSAGELSINRQILESAASLAVAGFAELHVVHVWQAHAENVLRVWSDDATEANIAAYVESERRRHEEGFHRLMTDFAAWVGEDALRYLAPQRHLVRGAPHAEVPALAGRLDVDLVVMGTVARTGVPGLIIGNTAETILEHIDRSVLAVKPAGFASPVTLA